MVSSRDLENLSAHGAMSAFLCLYPSNASNSKDASVSGSGTCCASIAPKAQIRCGFLCYA